MHCNYAASMQCNALRRISNELLNWSMVITLRIRITTFDINVVFISLHRALFESLHEYVGDGVPSILELLAAWKWGWCLIWKRLEPVKKPRHTQGMSQLRCGSSLINAWKFASGAGIVYHYRLCEATTHGLEFYYVSGRARWQHMRYPMN